jgi:O-antigen ligase
VSSKQSIAIALAAAFVAAGFYTSLAALAPTPPVGHLFVGRIGAAILVAILAIGAAIAGAALLRERAPIDPTSRLILGAWLGATLLSALLGLDPRSGVEVVAVMALCAVVHLGLRRFYNRPPVARTVFAVYLTVGSLASLAALGMLVLREPAELYALNHGRAAGFFVTANQFASYLLLLGYTAFGAALVARDRLLRSLAIAATAIAVVALVATISRAGWIGAVAGAVFLLTSAHRRSTALAAAGVLVVAIGALLALPVARHDPADSFNRIATADAGMRAAELFPLTGAGPMAYWRIYPSIRPPNGADPGTFGALHPHDVYLSLAGETGIVGLLAFAAGAFAFGRAIARVSRGRPAAARLPLAICAGLLATLVQGLFDTVGVVQMTFVWIPYAALALAAADSPGVLNETA